MLLRWVCGLSFGALLGRYWDMGLFALNGIYWVANGFAYYCIIRYLMDVDVRS
jgi:hypothetical protein